MGFSGSPGYLSQRQPSLPSLFSPLPPLHQTEIPEEKLKGYLKPRLCCFCPFKSSLNGFALAEESFSGALGWGWGVLVGEKGLSSLILLPSPSLLPSGALPLTLG